MKYKDIKNGEMIIADIWVGGDKPLTDPQKILSDNYGKETTITTLTQRRDQYIYVRIKNNTNRLISGYSAKLYITEEENISNQENWKVVYTDTNSNVSLFPRIKAKGIGVAKEVFIIPYNPFFESDNYYIIAKIENSFGKQNFKFCNHNLNNDISTKLKVSIFKIKGYCAKMYTYIKTGQYSLYKKFNLDFNILNCCETKIIISASRSDSKKELIYFEFDEKKQTDIMSQEVFLESYFYAYISIYIITNDISKITAAKIDIKLTEKG